MKQYRIDNKEKLEKQQREYRENNKDILKDKYKEWYNSDKGKEYLEKRKAKINIKIPCPILICGIEVSKIIYQDIKKVKIVIINKFNYTLIMIYNSKIATKLYNKKLKEIEKYTGSDTTYLSQLNNIGKQLLGSKFKGVFPSDKIPKLNNKSCYCILNVDKSSQSGSHWVSLIKMENGNSLFYDSFGREGVQLIKHLGYSGNGKIVDAELDKEQEIKENNCGARSLSFLCIYDEYGYEMAKWI